MFYYLLIFYSETISTEVFHLVQRQLEHYYDMILTDKKRIPVWSHRLHLALKAYQVRDHTKIDIECGFQDKTIKIYLVFQELLNTLIAMDKSTDHGIRESSKIIKSNIFYVPEYRETMFSQLLCFDEGKMSR